MYPAAWWAGVGAGLARDLLLGGALLGGYAWLAVLSARLRAVHRRLAAHLSGHAGRHARLLVDAADILRREAAERTQPLPAVHGSNEREEGR